LLDAAVAFPPEDFGDDGGQGADVGFRKVEVADVQGFVDDRVQP
jgi:hypothetical protein